MAVCSWCKKKVGEDCKKCQCGQVQYCSSRCQTKHLNEKHKDECKGPPDSGDDNDDWNSSDDDSEYILIDTRTKNQRKNHILDNWRGMSPEQVVAEVRNMYSNTATASSQLSLIKTAFEKVEESSARRIFAKVAFGTRGVPRVAESIRREEG